MYALFLASVLTSSPLAQAAPVQISFQDTRDTSCEDSRVGPQILDQGDHLALHVKGQLTVYGPYGGQLLSIDDEGLRWTYSGQYLLGVRMMGDAVPVMSATIVDTTTGERKTWEIDFSSTLENSSIEKMVIQGAPRSLDEIDFLFSSIGGAYGDKTVSSHYFHTVSGDVTYARTFGMPRRVARLSSQDGLTVTAAEDDHYTILQGETPLKVPLPDKAKGKKKLLVSPPYRYADNRWLVVTTTYSGLWLDELERTDDGWKVLGRTSMPSSQFKYGMEVLQAVPSGDGTALWLGNPASSDYTYINGKYTEILELNRIDRPVLPHASTLSLPPHSSPYIDTVSPNMSVGVQRSMLTHYTSGGNLIVLRDEMGSETYTSRTDGSETLVKKNPDGALLMPKGQSIWLGYFERGCWTRPLYGLFDSFALRGSEDSITFTSLLMKGPKSQAYHPYRLEEGRWVSGKSRYDHWAKPTPWPSFNVGPHLWVTSSLENTFYSDGTSSVEVTLTFPEPPENAPETVAEKE